MTSYFLHCFSNCSILSSILLCLLPLSFILPPPSLLLFTFLSSSSPLVFLLFSLFIKPPCSSSILPYLFPVLTCPRLPPLLHLCSSLFIFLYQSFLLPSPSSSFVSAVLSITPFSSLLLLFISFSLFCFLTSLLSSPPGDAPRTDGGGASGVRSVALTAVTLAGAMQTG